MPAPDDNTVTTTRAERAGGALARKPITRRPATDADRIKLVEEANKKARASTAKTRKYVVRHGHKIGIAQNVGAEGGDVVELTAKMAKHFNSHGCIEPYIPDDEDDEDA